MYREIPHHSSSDTTRPSGRQTVVVVVVATPTSETTTTTTNDVPLQQQKQQQQQQFHATTTADFGRRIHSFKNRKNIEIGTRSGNVWSNLGKSTRRIVLRYLIDIEDFGARITANGNDSHFKLAGHCAYFFGEKFHQTNEQYYNALTCFNFVCIIFYQKDVSVLLRSHRILVDNSDHAVVTTDEEKLGYRGWIDEV